MKGLLSRLVAVIIFSIIYLAVNGQNLGTGLEHLSINNGLSNNMVLSIFQDSKGFMWFGTHDGLNRFDGYNFIIYKKSEVDTNSLADNIVRCLAEDSNGIIWAGTNNRGLIRFDKKIQKFKNYVFNTRSLDKKIMEASINSIIIDKNNQIWMAAGMEGVINFNPQTEKFKAFKHNPNDTSSLGDNFLATFYLNKKKELFVGTSSGLSIYNAEKENFKNVYFEETGNKNIRINGIYEQTNTIDEIYWLASSVGLIKYNRTQQSYRTFMLFEKGTYEFEANNMLNICSPDGNLWIGTPNGIAIFNTQTNTFYPSSFVRELNNILIGNSILFSFIDKAGILWLSLDRLGIVKYDRKIRKFQVHKNNPYDNRSIPDKIVHSIFQNEDSTFWVGTIKGGLLLLDKNKKLITSFRNIKGDPKSLASDNINVVFEDSRGNLWIGYAVYGLNRARVTPKNRKSINQFIHYVYKPNGKVRLSHETVVAIFEDSKGRLWIGTEGGLDRFDYEQEIFHHQYHHPNDKNSLTHNSIQAAITEDKYGYLWVGTWGGLTKIDASDINNLKFIQYLNDPKKPESLSENRVISICIDKNENIWLGTFGGGLIKLAAEEAKKEIPENAKFKSYTETDGLSNNTIYCVICDDSGNLWMSTNKGLSKFNIASEKFTNYYESHGLQSNAFYWGSGLKGKTGELFFGGDKGFNSFFPDEISLNKYSPPVVITEFRIANEPVSIGENSVLKKSISETKELILNYKQKIFSLEFAALHYSVPENIKYKYMLEGFDNNWRSVGAKKRFATYTNLDPGEYIFRVKATNSEGYWSDKEANIKIIIKPPFWETIWFNLLIICVLVASIIAFYYFRINSIKKRNILLTKTVKERTSELNEKNKLLTQQTENLSEINTLLKQKQKMVIEQAEELKLQRDELYDSNAIKDKLFSIISHDLLGPASALKGIFEILEERFEKIDTEKKLQLIKASGESISSLHALLVNLLDWSRFQRGTINFDPVSTDLNKIIEANIKLVKSQLQNKNIEIKQTFEFNQLYIYLDSNLINTVVRNLLNNAIKFSQRNSCIEISYQSTQEEVTVAIKDNGKGMTEEVIEKIFDGNINYTTEGTQKEAGTGLGLNICKEFIKLHSGKIWVESKVDEGSTFFFSIPKNLSF